MNSIDNDVFLLETEKWDEKMAAKLAYHENVDLCWEHWKIVNFIREYYEDFYCIPPVEKICAVTGLKTIGIYKLFPRGPTSAYRIAGIPCDCLMRNRK